MDELLDILEEGLRASARTLVQRAQAGECTAAEVAQIRAMFKEAGGSLKFGGKTNEVGDEILASMADIDVDMLN